VSRWGVWISGLMGIGIVRLVWPPSSAVVPLWAIATYGGLFLSLHWLLNRKRSAK
jgi:hypothetical protein